MAKITLPIKTTSQRGKWVFKPLRSTIVTCLCGGKYIVTRENQTKCHRCLSGKTAQ